jgi:hypothetical protein
VNVDRPVETSVPVAVEIYESVSVDRLVDVVIK